jgi:hypothetical protein
LRVDPEHVARVGRRHPRVARTHGQAEAPSSRERKRRGLLRQRPRVEAQERRRPDLQRQDVPAVERERADRSGELPAHERATRAPVEGDDQAGAGARTADVLHRSDEPRARVHQVRGLPADQDVALLGAGGEIETQQRPIADGRPGVGERDPERTVAGDERSRLAANA